MIRFKVVTAAFLIATLFGISKGTAQVNPESFFDKAGFFLSEYVENGDVAYKNIAREPGLLKELVGMIGEMNLDDATSAEKKAFYINAYNLLTIYSIIDNGIPDSPLDVDGFFDGIMHTVARQELTLDDVEKGILYPEFSDARMHFALVCAAQGCPPLQRFAYQPSRLDSQLNTAARRALTDPAFIRVDDENGSVTVSQIFNWYEKDFLNEAGSVTAYINRYRDTKIPANYSLDYYEYDWDLNDSE